MLDKRSSRLSVFAIAALAGVSSAACSGSSTTSQVDGVGANSAQAGGTDIRVSNGDAGSVSSNGGAGSVQATLPAGFTAANKFGGYKLGAPITGTAAGGASTTSTDGCGTTILAVIRDFQADHKNFEGQTGDDPGMVQPILGTDRKPVWAHTTPTRTVADPTQLNSWYRNVDGLNKPFTLQLWFGPNAAVSSFQSTAFFPLDGQGWGNQGNPHNFWFTTEIHTEFKYQGGEVFNFTGDDDVWVFINNHLAIDLGGVHAAESKSVNIDQQAATLGLTKGQVYPFDMFQNERHTSESNFRADTDLEFVNCGVIVPETPPK